MNHSKAYKFTIVGLLIFSIVLSAFCFYLYTDNKRLNEQRADDNISNWGSILQMTQKIQDSVKTIEDVALFSFYQNTVLYTVSPKLNPAFNGSDFSFLTVMYDPLMQDLSYKEANKQVPEALLTDGLKLYLQMNTDLNKLCSFILTSAEHTPEFKYMLLKENSEISREVKTKINDFCTKYQPMLNSFFREISASRK